MRGRKRIIAPLLLAAICASVLGSVATSGAASPQVGEKPRDVLGSGSDTTYFMMSEIDQLYNTSAGCNVIVPSGEFQPLDNSCLADTPTTITTENYRHDRVSEAAPLGSSNGVSQLCQQGTSGVADIDFARSSRAPRDTDCSGLKFVAFAKDAVPWEGFPNVPGSPIKNMNNPDPLCAGKGVCLTSQQVTKIFVTCEITNWAQVGGNSAPIVVWAAQDGSGTRSAFDGFIGGASDSCISDPSHEIVENDNAPILASGQAANSIFYYSFGDWRTEVAPAPYGKGRYDGSLLGAVDGIRPLPNTIASGTFPYSRLVYNVYCDNCPTGINANDATRDYVSETGWICKPNTQHSTNPRTGVNYGKEVTDTISSQGFVPLPLQPLPGGGFAKCQVTST